MASDQQFCLRWNNHQSTLTAIFDLLLEEESLLDCTLAAEGQSLQAHRILLSACSPYFQSLLNQYAKKEPIIVLKDVTFKELRALMDYMYKGEVNVSQDELGALLKVAENLQIKGLSDSGGKATDDRSAQQRLAPPLPTQQAPTVPRSSVSNEHRRPNYHSTSDLRNDSPSALDESSLPRKRKRTRRRSSEDESGSVHNQSSTEPIQDLESLSLPSSLVIQPSITNTSTPPTSNTAVIPETISTLDRPPDHILPEPSTLPLQSAKTEPGLLQPKQENEDHEDDIEDLTMDDDYMDDSQPGPSHGSEGSTSNQGYPQWQMGTDGSFGEDLLRAQAAAGGTAGAGGSRESQDDTINLSSPEREAAFPCRVCNLIHVRAEDLNIADRTFQESRLVCPICKRKFVNPPFLLRVVLGLESDGWVVCPNCDQSFPGKSQLRAHIINFSGSVPPFVCCRCSGSDVVKQGRAQYKLGGRPRRGRN